MRFFVANTGKYYTYDVSSNFTIWTLNTISGVTANLNDVATFNGLTVFVVGNGGLIYKTTNSGSSWSQLNSSFSNGFYSISAVNNNYLMIRGSNNLALRTSNSGTEWNKISSFSTISSSQSPPLHLIQMI